MEPSELAHQDQTAAIGRDDAYQLVVFWTILTTAGIPTATAKTLLLRYADWLFGFTEEED